MTFTELIAIVSGIISIVMIVKFFILASDLRSMKDLSFKDANKQSQIASDIRIIKDFFIQDARERYLSGWKEEMSPYADIKLPNYTVRGCAVHFDDEKSGRISQEYGLYYFKDNNETLIRCHSEIEAVKGLYHTLMQKDESAN